MFQGSTVEAGLLEGEAMEIAETELWSQEVVHDAVRRSVGLRLR